MAEALPTLSVALLLGLQFLAAAAGAPAASPRPTLALEYLRGSEVAGCIDEGEFRGRVSAELGYDPFAPKDAAQPDETLRIQLGLQRGVFVADLELIGSDGHSVAQQRLRSSDPSCAALGAAVEVAVSVMFDRAEESPKPSPTEAELLALSPLPEISLPPLPPPPRPPMHLWAGVLVAVAADLRPAMALQVSMRRASYSLDLEARYATFGGGDLAARREWVGIAPCIWSGNRGGVGFCPVLIGGVTEIYGVNGSGALPELNIGARLAVSAPLGGPVALRLQAGLIVPVLITSTTVNGSPVTEPHVPMLDLGVGLSVEIL